MANNIPLELILLSQSEISSPTAAILSNVTCVYQLNVAPHTRYRSNGTALV